MCVFIAPSQGPFFSRFLIQSKKRKAVEAEEEEEDEEEEEEAEEEEEREGEEEEEEEEQPKGPTSDALRSKVRSAELSPSHGALAMIRRGTHLTLVPCVCAVSYS